MKNKFTVIFASCVLIFTMLACNILAGQPDNQPDLVLTITAQALLITQAAAFPTNTPAPNETQTPAPPTVPMAIVSQNTNCRTGPSTAYDIVTSLNAGQQAIIVGKDPQDNYWIVNNPNGSGTCWLWGQYVTVTGDTTSLPQIAPPPVPTQKATKTPKPTQTPSNTPTATSIPAPNAPSGLSQTRTCGGGYASDGVTPIWIEDVTVNWQDNADNETGFHIYKNNTILPAPLAANSTTFGITLRYHQGTGGALYDTFGVEAFNNAGASTRPAIDVPTCP